MNLLLAGLSALLFTLFCSSVLRIVLTVASLPSPKQAGWASVWQTLLFFCFAGTCYFASKSISKGVILRRTLVKLIVVLILIDLLTIALGMSVAHAQGKKTVVASEFHRVGSQRIVHDMFEFMECVKQKKLSDHGVWVGETFKVGGRSPQQEKLVLRASNGFFGPMGLSLYACPQGKNILFRAENDLGQPEFEVTADLLTQACTKSELIEITGEWNRKDREERRVVLECKSLNAILSRH